MKTNGFLRPRPTISDRWGGWLETRWQPTREGAVRCGGQRRPVGFSHVRRHCRVPFPDKEFPGPAPRPPADLLLCCYYL